MYARGLTAGRTRERLKDVYAVDAPPELTSRVTEEEKELAAVRRGRALEPFYPALFLDDLGANIRGGGAAVKKSAYGAGGTFRRSKRAWRNGVSRGLWIERNEGASDFSPRSGRAS